MEIRYDTPIYLQRFPDINRVYVVDGRYEIVSIEPGHTPGIPSLLVIVGR